MHTDAFVAFTCRQLRLTPGDITRMRLVPVLDVFISRLEEARARGAGNPLATVSAKEAGGNSRAATRRMLDQLGFEPGQRRAMHRLMAGTPSGWPGLLAAFAAGQDLNRAHRRYARRQVRLILTPPTVTGAPSRNRQDG